MLTLASRQRVRLPGETAVGLGPGEAGELTVGLGPAGDVAVTQQRRGSARRDRHWTMSRLKRDGRLCPVQGTDRNTHRFVDRNQLVGDMLP